ncbi:MAG: alpha/beta fold hydrolase [Candidatus Thiodiazotropha sp. (ex Cardiolucina cf. quadrata)]|nr:alpha/beta fold hydrolase [Candidatus Thiodiazotropha sp. (ex Cardiolucina cf. quadrata)]
MCENPYYTAAQHGDYDLFELDDFVTDQGTTLRNATLAYKTFGQLNKEADNAILFPVMFSGTHAAMASYVGNELALNPEKYFIIIPNQLGGGLSTSPHNTQGAYGGASFPKLSIVDDVRAQHKLLTEHFGIRTLQLVTGWSMGAQQTYEWAVRYPDMVARALPIAGTAKTTPHCTLYVDVFCEALSSDPAWDNGAYKHANDVSEGLRRMARVFAMMGASHELFNEKSWTKFGFSSTEDFLSGFWENWFLPMDPNNLLCMANKWRSGDVSQHAGGDLESALRGIKAKVLVVAFEQDMFITETDCRREQHMIANSEFVSIPSQWGHFSMLGMSSDDFKIINDCLEGLLAVPA